MVLHHGKSKLPALPDRRGRQADRDREGEIERVRGGRGVRVEGFREGDKKQGANESGFFSFPCILTLLPQMHLFSLITCGSYHIFWGVYSNNGP